MIETQRLDRSVGESAFQFVEDGKVTNIPLHEAQRAQLVRGMLARVRLGTGYYELVPLATADKIGQRDPTCVLVLNTQSGPQPNPASDPYVDYPVPDGLMW